MQSWIRRILEPLLAVAAAALLVILVVPWKETALPALGAKAAAASPPAHAPGPELARAVAPDAILPLFVGRQVQKPTPPPAPPAPQAQPAPKRPVAATWLRYMGRSAAPDGTSSVYLKDTRSGKVLKAAQGVAMGGWLLLSEDEATLVLSYGEDLYSVSKR